jgi:hypothetical protein
LMVITGESPLQDGGSVMDKRADSGELV